MLLQMRWNIWINAENNRSFDPNAEAPSLLAAMFAFSSPEPLHAPFFGANQSANAAAVLKLTYDDNQKATKASLLISLFHTATKILLAFICQAAWQHRYYSTKVGHNWRKDVLEGHAPFYFNFFCKNVCTINFTVSFYLYLYLQPREKCFFFKRWVTWSWHNIQRWNGSCILFL